MLTHLFRVAFIVFLQKLHLNESGLINKSKIMEEQNIVDNKCNINKRVNPVDKNI